MMLLKLLARDLALARSRAGAAALPVVFFLLVAAVFPFAVGPDRALLARVGAGVVWMAALLAALLPVPTLFEADRADGTLDQYAARGIAAEMVAAARLVAHWVGFAAPLLLAAPLAGLMLNLDGRAIARLEGALALGTPGLAALAVIAAALTTGAREGGMLAGLLVLPLAAPLLIFGAGAAGGAGGGAPKLLAAVSLLLVAAAPFAAGAGLRAARS